MRRGPHNDRPNSSSHSSLTPSEHKTSCQFCAPGSQCRRTGRLNGVSDTAQGRGSGGWSGLGGGDRGGAAGALAGTAHSARQVAKVAAATVRMWRGGGEKLRWLAGAPQAPSPPPRSQPPLRPLPDTPGATQHSRVGEQTGIAWPSVPTTGCSEPSSATLTAQ